MTDAAQRFTLLYDQCQPRVLAYARSRASQEVAEEVASATFLVAWERLDRLPDPALPWRCWRSPATWSASTTAEPVRSRPRWPCWAPGRPPEPRSRTSPRWWPSGRSMLRALASLSAVDQEVLTLVAWHGLTAREAATVLGCSRAALFVPCTGSPSLAPSELVARDPAHFGVRLPAGTTILSITWLETGWTDRVGQQP